MLLRLPTRIGAASMISACSAKAASASALSSPIGSARLTNPLINQSAPLRPPQNRCRIESGEQGIGSMRAIMQGLTDAEFEQLYGTEEQCLAAWVKVRREAGMACPRCGNPKSYV